MPKQEQRNLPSVAACCTQVRIKIGAGFLMVSTGGTQMWAESMSLAMRRLKDEDAVGQLRRRDGRMAVLGSENGELKLDWVEGVARLLADQDKLEQVEDEAIQLWQQGIRHIIWAGMGGSVLTVKVLSAMGFCSSHDGDRIAVYPLDSTDPAALNAIIRRIAGEKQLTLPEPGTPADQAFLQVLLRDTMMIGVSMGMTSEEPITHLTWFSELLEQAQLSPAEHILVMTLPGSYLDQFARERNAPSRPLQLDGGTGTGGRMSAPTTRVFLLPAALYLTRATRTRGQLRAALSLAWQDYQLDIATAHPEVHPFVQLAVAAYNASINGACRMLVEMPDNWKSLVPWIEQLMEESLGKAGKGIVVFQESAQHSQAAVFHTAGTLHVQASPDPPGDSIRNRFILYQPYLRAYLTESGPTDRLASVATCFLGWQLTMALYGYLHDITFAGQPAVENYKARARALRSQPDPLEAVHNWPAKLTDGGLTLFAPSKTTKLTPAQAFARALRQATTAHDEQPGLGYLDLTINGELPAKVEKNVFDHLYLLGNTLLHVPVKPRHAPADYHSTEQSEMDGPSYLVSLRILAREHEKPLIGNYNDAFLRAQAVSTWQAMIGQNRTCFLLVIDGTTEQVATSLQRFFEDVEQHVK
jgi:glucose-6-phosphate isomerase